MHVPYVAPRQAIRVLTCCALLSSSGAAIAAPFPSVELDAYVAKVMQDWAQPGIAIAIVADDRIVHERGFGVRSVAKRDLIDAQTLFGIASVSKSFAATAVAKLVAEGRMDWDDPVTKHLPWFRMPRERDTDEVTLRDLLSMRSGFASSEYTFRRASANRTDHVRRIRYLQQQHPLRSQYLYTTDSYTAIGEVVAAVTQQPWELYAQANLWKPLGMSRTNADHTRARADDNSATPHLTIGNRKQPIEWIYEDYNALPAGGVNSTAHDLALWLRFHLNEGTVDGKALLPAAVLREIHSPQTPERGPFAKDVWAEVAGVGADRIQHVSYAMGWQVHTYRGHDVVSHSGAIDGFRSLIGFLPQQRIGIVVLSNADQSSMPKVVFQTAVDFAIGRGTSGDWNRRFLQRAAADRAATAARLQAVAEARLSGTTPSLPLPKYAGRFADNGAFGEVRISVKQNGLLIEAGRMQYALEHWHHDVFKARPRWPYEMEERNFFVDFRIDERANVDAFHFSTGSDFARIK